MNEHPSDSLPAFVLGALDVSEARAVAEHLRGCPACRDEAEAFQAIVGLIPYSVAAAPPPHIKHQLLARVVSSQADLHASEPPARPARRAPRWSVRLLGFVTACSLALALALGWVALDMRMQLVAQQRQTRILQQQLVSFLAAPNTVGRSIAPRVPGVDARMFMQPGHHRVVLVVHGLQPLPGGQTYQFWLADSQGPVPAQTFSVSQEGTAELVIDAPNPVDAYAAVMVTVEQYGGSQAPSELVVLQASL